MSSQLSKLCPKLVFVVPYRDREQQLAFFRKQMATILEDMPKEDYRILYVHQSDNRSFNRGALKNIGFLFVQREYPETYANITLVFNDLDTMPFQKGFLNYATTPGVVKHFYGFKFALGGIVSIRAADFERINGFPNFWAWGYEDNMLQKRAHKAGLFIDRSQFYPLLDKNIMHFGDGLEKEVNRKEFDRYLESTTEGIRSIQDLSFDFDESTNFVNVRHFDTGTKEDLKSKQIFDIRTGRTPFPHILPKNDRGACMRMRMV